MTKLAATNTQIVGISTDSSASHKKFCESEKLNFPLLSDSGRKVCKLYGVYWPQHNLSSRATFIIDKRGIIRKIDKHVNPANHGTDLVKELRTLRKEVQKL